jgi:threonine synthase
MDRQRLVGEEDDALVVNTGSGLKDVRSAMIAAGQAPVIAPTMDALEAYLNEK